MIRTYAFITGCQEHQKRTMYAFILKIIFEELLCAWPFFKIIFSRKTSAGYEVTIMYRIIPSTKQKIQISVHFPKKGNMKEGHIES